jgi:hypothetical protein
MQLHQDKIPRNMFREPDMHCPFWPQVANNIITMLERIPAFDYDSASDFQQKLIVEYWHYFDGLESAFRQYGNIKQWIVFRQWFIQSATPPEHIRRASQWLIEPKNGGFIELRPKIRGKALETADKARQSIGKFNAEHI